MTQANNQSQAPAVQESAFDSALKRISELQNAGQLKVPNNYSPENAVRSAWLLIQQTTNSDKHPALNVCTQASIANALLSMVLNGLNPDKKQCYFIVYGNKLEMQKSYFGQIAISKRVAGVKEAVGIPIYQDDIFKYTIDVKTGTKTVTQHDQDFINIDIAKLKGAYAVVMYEDGRTEYEIMTMHQIRTSWEMGKANGNSPAHKKFPDQMACKTVVNRALKIPVNSSNDEDLFDESTKGEQISADVAHEISEHANVGSAIGFEEPLDNNAIAEGQNEGLQYSSSAQAEPIVKDNNGQGELDLNSQQKQRGF